MEDVPSINPLISANSGIFFWSQVQEKYSARRPAKCSPTASAEDLAELIWWYVCRYFLGLWIQPTYSGASGTLKQQCQYLDLRGFPSRCSTWGDRCGHRAQGNCAEHHQRRVEERGRDTASPLQPIPPPLTLRSGRRDTGLSERNNQHTEHYTPHWENELSHEELKW